LTSSIPKVDQSKAKANQDIVAGDKLTAGSIVNNYGLSKSPSLIQTLMEKLQSEIDGDVKSQQTVDTLLFYQKKKSHDGIYGLEAKLQKADRQSEIIDALEYKELFSKLLYRFSLYDSAQEIFAFLLARVDRRFRIHVEPMLDQLDDVQIDALIYEQIIEPIVSEVGDGVFTINDAVVAGMVYWMAEQCFVRWHK
jgi:hypothetical protein